MTYLAKLTSKGQITLPADLRAEMELETGDHVAFEATAHGLMISKAETGLEALKGMVPYDGPTLSDEDIVSLVDDALAYRDDRGSPS